MVKTFGRGVDLPGENHIVERLATERCLHYFYSLVGRDYEFFLNLGHSVLRANGVGGSEIDISRHSKNDDS